MAQKPAKKAPAKKVAAKKAPVAKAAVKPAVKKVPVKKVAAKKVASVKTVAAAPAEEKVVMTAAAAAPCAQGCGCGCNGGGKCKCGGARFLKKLVIFLVIFALGFAAAKFCTMYKFHKGFRGPRVEFVNGCVDMEKIPCPEMAAKIAAADVNGDGCVAKDEFKAAKKEMRREMFKQMRGKRSGCPMAHGESCGCGAKPVVQE